MGAPQIVTTTSGHVTGHWGSFWDITPSQTVPSANGTTTVAIGQSDPANSGVSITSGNRVTFDSAGVYSITFSIQFSNNSATMYLAQLWLRKNGTTSAADVPDSNSRFSVTGKHGSTDGHVLGTVNFVMPMSAGDYISLMFSAQDVAVSIETLAATTGTPTVPRTPGVILTAVQI